MRKLVGIFLIAAACIACSNQDETKPVIRLDQAMHEYASLSDTGRDSLVNLLRPEFKAFFAVLGYDSLYNDDILSWSQSDVVKVFQPDIDSVFENIDGLESQVSHMRAVDQKHHWGLTDSLCFATVAWGRPQPIVRCDSVMLIALNHYLGEQYPGYSHWDYYRRTEKTPKNLPYDLAGAIAATKHPFKPHHAPTLLSWMLYEGALMHARMMLVDQAQLDIALGYTPDELEYLEDNTQGIWDDMRIMRVVYTTDPALIDRYIAPSAVTPLINYNAPGRVGRYIGYKIVMDYVKRHPEATLNFLLSPEFYDTPQSLIDSGF